MATDNPARLAGVGGSHWMPSWTVPYPLDQGPVGVELDDTGLSPVYPVDVFVRRSPVDLFRLHDQVLGAERLVDPADHVGRCLRLLTVWASPADARSRW